MNLLHSTLPGAPRWRTSLSKAAAGILASAVLLVGAMPATALAQPGRGPGPGPGWGDRRDIHVDIDPHAGPRFFAGPDRQEFRFFRDAPQGRHIDSRDFLLGLLLRPAVDAVVWGIGDIATAEVANSLGLPVQTTVYGVQPNVAVYSSVPPGYFVAEAVPANVALVTSGPAGPVVLVRRVPPGAFIAYQSSATGVVLNECVVVPPVQQVVMVAAPTTPAPTVVMAPTPAPAPIAAPAPAAPASSAETPMAVNKMSRIVYDQNGKPMGVIVLESDGKQEFVPLQQ